MTEMVAQFYPRNAGLSMSRYWVEIAKKINISLRRIQRRIQNLHVQKFPARHLNFYYR